MALARGDLSFWKAREIAVGSQKLSDPAKARRFEDRVLHVAGEGQARYLLHHQAGQRDPVVGVAEPRPGWEEQRRHARPEVGS